MTKKNAFWILILPVLLLSACSAVPTSAPTVIVELTSPPAAIELPQTEADVPRVAVEEALAALNGGEAVIVDVRSTESFVAKHIAGAVSMPLARIEDAPAGVNLDKNQWIITYCA